MYSLKHKYFNCNIIFLVLTKADENGGGKPTTFYDEDQHWRVPNGFFLIKIVEKCVNF